MKNIQIIDGALNCTYDIFAASDADFALIFPDDRDIEFSDDFMARVGKRVGLAVYRRLWKAPVDKKAVIGIHGALFFDLDHKKRYYPTKRDGEAIVALDEKRSP
jgi:hypothetical protein